MDEAQASRRPTKLVLAAVGLFVLAVVLGRLLVAGGALWALLALALPVVLIALGAAFGFPVALGFTAVFTGVVLGVRWFLKTNPAGWVALMLLPVVALTAYVVGRVLAQLRRKRAGDVDAAAEPVDVDLDAERTSP